MMGNQKCEMIPLLLSAWRLVLRYRVSLPAREISVPALTSRLRLRRAPPRAFGPTTKCAAQPSPLHSVKLEMFSPMMQLLNY